jgi:U1 small nuclear ribonucleoprotein
MYSPYFHGPPPSMLGFSRNNVFPPHLNILFRARPPLIYLKPVRKRRCKSYDCLRSKSKNWDDIFENGPAPERVLQPTPQEIRQKKLKSQAIHHYLEIKKKRAKWDPECDPKITSDPHHTLFVSNLNYKTTEDILQDVFEEFGRITSIRIVRNIKTHKSRGYGFIEYKHRRDLKRAYRKAEGIKLQGRYLKVDYERARIDDSWFP